MKIRNGFVSNSSSSSFVIFVLNEKYNDWIRELNEYEFQVIMGLDIDHIIFNGLEVVTLSGTSGDYNFYDSVTLNRTPDDKELSLDQLCDKYGNEFYASEFWTSARSKLPKDCIYKTVDF